MRDISIYLIVFVVVLLTLMLQINLFDILKLVGTTANLGVVLIATIGLMTGKERGAAIGATYGLMLDIIEGKSIGLFLGVYLLLGYFCGRIGKSISKENKTTTVAIVGIGTIFLELAVYLMEVMLYHVEITPITFGVELMKEALYNMLLAIISFRFLYQLSDLINRTKKNYYML